jgi:hypothetical protein
MFSYFLVDTESEMQEVVFNDITWHLRDLQCMFLKYFSPQLDSLSWVRNLLSVKAMPDKITSQNYESCTLLLISHWRKIEQVPLTEFWCSLLEEYQPVSELSVLKLLLFPTTYTCEVGFSRYVAPKKCTGLNVSPDVSPNFRLPCDKIKKYYPSHWYQR